MIYIHTHIYMYIFIRTYLYIARTLSVVSILEICQQCYSVWQYFWFYKTPHVNHMAFGDCLNIKISSYQYRDPHVEEKDHLMTVLSLLGIPIPGKDSLYIETGPWSSWGFTIGHLAAYWNETHVLAGVFWLNFKHRASSKWFNTLRPRQNGQLLTDDIFTLIFMNENVSISINITLKFVPYTSLHQYILIMISC